MSRPTWTNWGRTSRADPARIARPASVDDVARVLHGAAADGLAVRPVGSAHSFTALARTDGVLVETARLAGLRSVDRARRRITVGGGTTIAETARIAARHGLAFENIGDVDQQTIAGAIGTGTHGTGLRFGPIASRVVGVQLVTPAGGVLDIGEHDPLLPAARVSLGALGIITAVTLQLVPAFGLEADERAEDLGPVLAGFADRAAAVDHFEFYWFPGTEVALTKSNRRIPADAVGTPRARLRALVEDEVVANGVFALTCRLGREAPSLVPAINRFAARTVAERTYRGPSHEVFVAPRRVRFAESEWAVPLDRLPAAFTAFRRALERSGLRISFPVEVRAVAADQSAWLSTSAGRPSGYIAVHCYARHVQPEYFRIAERVFLAFEGRPHWGKLHTRSAEDLRDRYPHFDDFVAVRRRLDPAGLLRNTHLDRVLGPL